MSRFFKLLLLLPCLATGQIRIDTKSFDTSEKNVRALLESVVLALPDAKIPPLYVTNSREGPLTLYDRSPRGEVIIHLNVRSTYWSQYVYQFAHELMHVRCGFRNDAPENKWLEETFCEIASLHALQTLSVTWEKHAPLPHLKNYRHHLSDYAQKIIASREKVDLEKLPLFYAQHRTQLRADSTLRPLNGAMAATLLPLFKNEPKNFLALATLNKTPAKKDLSLAECFTKWAQDSPPNHRPFILSLTDHFLKYP